MQLDSRLIVFAILVSASPALADLYVDPDATGSTHDGSSWCSALLTVQDALVLVAPFETIRVAQGSYKPDRGGGQTLHDTTATFQLINDVTLKGGYAGCGAPNPNRRDIDGFETVLSGDLLGNDGPNFQNYGDNSLHVVTGTGTDATAVLDGFTVRGGNAIGGTGNDSDYFGGGVFNIFGSPTVIRCKLIENSADCGANGLDSYLSSETTLLESHITDSTVVKDDSRLSMIDSVLDGTTSVEGLSTLEGSGLIRGWLNVAYDGVVEANLPGQTLEIGGTQTHNVSGILRASSSGTLLLSADVNWDTSFGSLEVNYGNILAGANVSISANALEIAAGGIFASHPAFADTNGAELHVNTINIHDSPPGGLPGAATFGGTMLGNTSGNVTLDGSLAASDSSSTPPILNVNGNAGLHVGGNLIIDGAAIIQYDSTEPLELEGHFDNMSVKPDGFEWREGKIIFVAPGSPAPTQIVEAAGRTNSAATLIAAEYEFGSMELPTGARVLVVDSRNNDQAGQSSCSEALYVDELILRAGATLTILDTAVYYKTLVNEGATIDPLGCGFIALNPFCSTASQCDDGDSCTLDICDAGGACSNDPGGMQIRFEHTMIGRGYCSNDATIACVVDGDCESNDCRKSAYNWPGTSVVEVAYGSFTNSSQLATYPYIGVVPGFTEYFWHPSDPGPGASYWYILRFDCPVATSWQTSAGAEPGRDAWIP